LDLAEMSLINKMLQDLDSRGSGPSGSLASSVKLTQPTNRHISWPLVVGVVAIIAFVAAAGMVGWRYYKAQQAIPSLSRFIHPVAAPVSPAAAKPAAKLPPPMVDATGSPIVPAKTSDAIVPAPTMLATAASAAQAAVSAPVASAPAASAAALAPAASAAVKVAAASAATSAPIASASAELPAARAASTSAAAPKAQVASAKAGAKARKEQAASKPGNPARAGKSAPPAASVPGMAMTNNQRAEAEYRKGLVALQDGRNGEAIAALEQAVRLEPTHEAARQTVVGLLVEARRTEEALRHLQLGLTLEPRQPAMAMLLARLQIERGASGIETLMRTLPYATGNSEYHAFLAGALARESRHQEAAEHYRLALRGAPQSGVWWIGLAMSLQAEKRDAEALDAFKRAKAAGTLTPELNTFAERKINALTR
jgi:MSHA biogenesis protein MshN